MLEYRIVTQMAHCNLYKMHPPDSSSLNGNLTIRSKAIWEGNP